MVKFYDLLKEKYLTWKTGKTKEERIWQAWKEETINYRASTVQKYFYKFKYVIEVDPDKLFDLDALSWVVVDEFDQYMWPQRDLNDNAVYTWARGFWEGDEFEINELGGGDHVFVATNNDKDAMMISLMYV